MGQRIKGIVLYSKDGILHSHACTIYSETELEQLYKELNCTQLELIYRTICDIPVEIWCDEEGLLKNNLEVCALGIREINGKMTPLERLVGKIFICSTNEKGSSKSLTEKNFNEIMDIISLTDLLIYKI